jgi:hypothetical protein
MTKYTYDRSRGRGYSSLAGGREIVCCFLLLLVFCSQSIANSGAGVIPKSTQFSFQRDLEAAKDGSVDAELKVGRAFSEEIMTARPEESVYLRPNRREAFKWFSGASRGGSVEASAWVGSYYLFGPDCWGRAGPSRSFFGPLDGDFFPSARASRSVIYAADGLNEPGICRPCGTSAGGAVEDSPKKVRLVRFCRRPGATQRSGSRRTCAVESYAAEDDGALIPVIALQHNVLKCWVWRRWSTFQMHSQPRLKPAVCGPKRTLSKFWKRKRKPFRLESGLCRQRAKFVPGWIL